jgi:putative membrane protein insertion efficiency factor
MVARALILAIRIYQKLLSPLLPPSCRFYPTCSAYSAQAIARYGAARGLVLTFNRLRRCHPWDPGGFDPLV